MPTMHNWSFTTTSPFCPPEHSQIRIHGEVEDHPKSDGFRVKLSSGVFLASDKEFVSRSGRVWQLGEPAKGTTVEEFLKEFGRIAVGRFASGNPMPVPSKKREENRARAAAEDVYWE